MPVLGKVAGLLVASHSRNSNSIVVGSIYSFTPRRYLGTGDFQAQPGLCPLMDLAPGAHHAQSVSGVLARDTGELCSAALLAPEGVLSPAVLTTKIPGAHSSIQNMGWILQHAVGVVIFSSFDCCLTADPIVPYLHLDFSDSWYIFGKLVPSCTNKINFSSTGHLHILSLFGILCELRILTHA